MTLFRSHGRGGGECRRTDGAEEAVFCCGEGEGGGGGRIAERRRVRGGGVSVDRVLGHRKDVLEEGGEGRVL